MTLRFCIYVVSRLKSAPTSNSIPCALRGTCQPRQPVLCVCDCRPCAHSITTNPIQPVSQRFPSSPLNSAIPETNLQILLHRDPLLVVPPHPFILYLAWCRRSLRPGVLCEHHSFAAEELQLLKAEREVVQSMNARSASASVILPIQFLHASFYLIKYFPARNALSGEFAMNTKYSAT